VERYIGADMKNKKNLGLILGLILSLYTLYPAYAQEDAVIEQDASQQSSEVKVDKETPDKVEELIKKKEYAAALPLINAYIEAKPKKYQGYKLRGEVYYALRQYALAVQDFQKAVDIKTDNDKFATGTKVISAVVLGADKKDQYQNPELGSLYAQLMYAQKAVNNNMYEVSYKKALEYNSHQYLPAPKKEDISRINCPQKYGKLFNPQGIDAVITGVIDDIEKGHFSEAVYKLPKITGEYPDYYLGQYLTGVVMHGMEQEQDAITAFNNSITLNPNDFESYASLGLIYYEQAAKTFNKDLAQKSISNFKKALELNPNCHTYYFYIGLNQLELGNYDNAVDNFKKALSIKNNDYNSMYYKAIAQYLQKDYEGTVEETTGMLYRRVSNYNSVMYLRALAYYKLKNEEAAFADIEKIHQNKNDIYNIDIKPLTAKEQALDSYLYYLQSRISRDNGLGAKSDLQKAYKNPVIALLDTRKTDFEHANFKLTSSDIENQYEYLITTFGDLGVDFKYLNPDYKIIARKQNVQQTEEKVAEKPQTVEQTDNKTDSLIPEVQTSEENEELAADNTEPVLSEEEIQKISDSADETLTNTQTEEAKQIIQAKEEQTISELLTPQDTVIEGHKEETQVSEILTPQDTAVEEPKKETQDSELLATKQDTQNEVLKELEQNAEDIVKTAQESSQEIEKDVKEVVKEVTEEIDDMEAKAAEVKELLPEILTTPETKGPEQTSLEPSVQKPETEKSSPVIVYDPDTLIFQTDEPQEELSIAQLKDMTAIKEEIPVSQSIKNETPTENIIEEKPHTLTENKQVPTISTHEVITAPEQVAIEPTKVPELREENIPTQKVQEVPAEKPAEIIPAKEPETIITPKEEPVVNKKTQTGHVKEKFANVNMADFEVKNKKLPELKEDDEVIFLEPESFLKKQEKQVQENLNKLSLLPDTNIQPKEEKLTLPAKPSYNPEKTVDVNITKDSDSINNSTTKDDDIPELQVIEPEEIVFPKVAEQTENTQDVKEIDVSDKNSIQYHDTNKENTSVTQYSKENLEKETVENNIIPVNNQEKDTVIEETTVPETPETIEQDPPKETPVTLQEENTIEEQETQTKKKKAKKSKQKDNLITAVGANPEDYIEPTAKQEKVKKVKFQKHKDEMPEITESTVLPVPVDTEIVEKVTDPEVEKTPIPEIREVAKNIKSSAVVNEAEKSLTSKDTEPEENKPNIEQEEKTLTVKQEEVQTTEQVEKTPEKESEQVEKPQNKEEKLTQQPTEEEVKTEIAEQTTADEIKTENKNDIKAEEPSDNKEGEIEKPAVSAEPEQVSEDKVNPAAEQNEVSEEENSEKKADVTKEKKTKKVSFWKRLFSRKKPVSNTENTIENVPETPAE